MSGLGNSRDWLIGNPKPKWWKEMRAAGVSKDARDAVLALREHLAQERADEIGGMLGMDAVTISHYIDNGIDQGLLRFFSCIDDNGEKTLGIEPTEAGRAFVDGTFSSFGGGAK